VVVTAQHCEAALLTRTLSAAMSAPSLAAATLLQCVCKHVVTFARAFTRIGAKSLKAPYPSAPNSMLLLLLLLLLHFCVQASLCTTSTCTSWAAASCVGHLAKWAAFNMHRDGLMNCWTTSQADSKHNSVLHCKVRQLRKSISCSWDRSFFHTGM
jgi:hypothetical protein